MSDFRRGIVPLAWLLYLAIAFEIAFMIGPFALYYYSTYGPSLNFLHNWPETAWLTGFFLPHFVQTSSSVLNALPQVGRTLFLGGLVLFLVGAGQIYYGKFAKKGPVTGGLYRYVRNPQYTAFSVMGLGVLLVWPRFTVLVMFVAMLFIYYFIARAEQRDCEEQFGIDFKAYVQRTSAFLPGDSFLLDRMPSLPPTRFSRLIAILILCAVVTSLSIAVASGMRSYSLARVSISYSGDSATIATALTKEEDIDKALKIAMSSPKARDRLTRAGFSNGGRFLNYVVPIDWYLADLPLEILPTGLHGHHRPESRDQDEYKVLFTRAQLFTNGPVSGADMIKRTFARVPILVVKLNTSSGEILGIETPPANVRWGDIPTPLF